MKLLRTVRGINVYEFQCENEFCMLRGELAVGADSTQAVGCPKNCGAVYLQHRNAAGELVLSCVVQPTASV